MSVSTVAHFVYQVAFAIVAVFTRATVDIRVGMETVLYILIPYTITPCTASMETIQTLGLQYCMYIRSTVTPVYAYLPLIPSV